jgi:hypothetical protein
MLGDGGPNLTRGSNKRTERERDRRFSCQSGDTGKKSGRLRMRTERNGEETKGKNRRKMRILGKKMTEREELA